MSRNGSILGPREQPRVLNAMLQFGMPVWFWRFVDRALRTRAAAPWFFVLYRSEISSALDSLRAAFPLLVLTRRLKRTPNFKHHINRNRSRLCISAETRFAVSEIQFDHDRRNPDADQFLVDAVRLGGKPLRDFLSRQETNPAKPYWTPEYSKSRVAAVKALLRANPRDFVISVGLTDKKEVLIIDGHHRLRVAQLRGVGEITVVFGVRGIPTIDWDNPRTFFLGRLDKKKKKV
jgi:hypothetical protein